MQNSQNYIYKHLLIEDLIKTPREALYTASAPKREFPGMSKNLPGGCCEPKRSLAAFFLRGVRQRIFFFVITKRANRRHTPISVSYRPVAKMPFIGINKIQGRD